MGSNITMGSDGLVVPDDPVIPFIEGDGIGPDIWGASVRVFDTAVEKAYDGQRKIAWKEVLAGEKAFNETGDWLPEETVSAFQDQLVGIKGPLTTPVGGGIRSLNVALRQIMDLYACVRPVRWFEGVPSPVKNPGAVDMIIFRENTEDVYAGKELEEGTEEVKKLIAFLKETYDWDLPEDSGVGIKPISINGSKRLVRAALRHALQNGRRSVTIVHKGNIMKFTEGAFRNWGYEVVREEFADVAVAWEDCGGEPGDKLLVQDVIADAMLQQVLTRPANYDVLATTNLNGDYISDDLAAQDGGIGIAPGGNINYDTGVAVFEATHGTAPKYADKNMANPGSVILSGEMMLRYLGWNEAADLIISGLEGAIKAKTVTYDFERLMEGATKVGTSEFGDAILDHM